MDLSNEQFLSPVVERARDDERKRVEAMLDRDRRDRVAEANRKLAESEVEGGSFGHIEDTVIPPTEEWHQHGASLPYTPKLIDGTVRTVQTRRRIQNPYVRRLWNASRIEDDHYQACIWYRTMHEQSGLVGRMATTRFSAEARSGDAALGICRVMRGNWRQGWLFARRGKPLARPPCGFSTGL